MGKIIFSNSEKPIDINEINELERKYRLSFAEDYKHLILEFNGGNPNKTLYEGNGESLILSELFPIKYGKYTLENAIIKFKIEDKLIPDTLIPIGADPADNLICLSQDTNEYGSIYIWMHDSIKALRYVTNSLTEILNNLQEFEW